METMEKGNCGEKQGRLAATFYEKARQTARVLKSHEIPWEQTPKERKKDLTGAVKPVFLNLDACIHVLPPGGSSEQHRHMAEELVYILEGCGYDLHWEEAPPAKGQGNVQSQPAPTRYDWQQGDTIYIPVNILHQHFNVDVERPARFLSATSRIPEQASLDRIEQSPPLTAG